MSKKMMKRSLALGALMAFVITGSAMAQVNVTNNTTSLEAGTSISYNCEGDNNSSKFNSTGATNYKEYVLLEGTKNAVESVDFKHKGDGLTHYAARASWGGITEITDVDNITLSGSWTGGVFFAQGKHSVTGEFSAVKLTDIGSIKTIGTGDVQIFGAQKGAEVLVYANDIDVTGYVLANDTYKDDEKGSVITLNAKNDISISSSNSAIITQLGDNNITLTAGRDISIVSDKNAIDSTNRWGEDGYQNNNIIQIIAGNNVSIVGKEAAIYAADFASDISISGKTVNIDGNIDAIATDAKVNVIFNGTTSSFKGRVKTESGSQTSLTFNEGATWSLSEASSLTNATFNAGSVLKIKGADFVESTGNYVLKGVGDKDVLTVKEGAKLTVEGIAQNTYNIAKGFETITGADKWEITDLNTLMEGKWLEDETKGLQLQVVAKEAEKIAEDLGVSEATGDFLSNLAKDAGESNVKPNDGSAEGKLKGLANAAANSQNDKVIAKAAAQAVEAVQKMAEAGGNSATAANVVTNVTNVTGQRLSFSGGNAGGNKGGHGVGLLEEGSGAAIWAQYVHGKDSVENMPSEAGASSYEGQYNGIVMGVDFKKVGKFQSGIAFNYGEGDTNSVNTTSPTRSEYDFWGVGYYGNIRNADSNVIFDIGYAKTDSDVTSNVVIGTHNDTFEASPETTTWTAGVKVEKLYQNNNVQVVPYTGLRYMSIDPEDYSTKCGAMGYKMERQDIWLLPVGVSIKQEIVNPNGWVVTPKVDLSYIWAFGDTDSTMETNTVFGTDNRPVGYDVMDDGSWMGLVGVEAAMDDWTFGVSYSYQKGDHSESKKWYVDAKYSF